MNDYLEITDEMIEQYKPLVKFTIGKYFKWVTRLKDNNKDFDYRDVYQTGMVALIKALRAYDESKGKFSSYVIKCIRNEIMHEHVLKHDEFKVSRTVMMVYGDMKRNKSDTTFEAAKEKYNAGKKVYKMASELTKMKYVSISEPFGEQKKREVVDIVEDRLLLGQIDNVALEEILDKKLTKKEKNTLLMYLDGYDQQELADMEGKTQAAVSNIIVRAKAKLEREYHILTGGIVCNN